MLNWQGDQVKRHVHTAAMKGVNSIMADCVKDAKADVSVVTALLQGSIQLRAARLLKDVVVGIWGSFGVKYALPVELGTRPHLIRPRSKKALYWKGAEHPVKVVHHPGTRGKPYLRPAADKNYPNLAARIRSYLK